MIRSEPAEAASAAPIEVRLARPLLGWQEDLASHLGEGYRVGVGLPGRDGYYVAPPASPAAVSSFRAAYPAVALVLVEPSVVGPSPASTAALLNAGAATYVAAASPVVLAAHVRAMDRRRRAQPIVVNAPLAPPVPAPPGPAPTPPRRRRRMGHRSSL